jgi:hypothetical protein
MAQGIGDKVASNEKFLVSEGVGLLSLINSSTDAKVGGMRDLGSLTEVSFSHTFSEVEIKETRSGNGNTAASFITDKEVEVTLTFKSFEADNLVLFTLGDLTSIASAVAKTGSQTVDTGWYYQLDDLADFSTNAFVLTGNGGTPVYEEGKNYEIDGSGTFHIYSDSIQTSKGAAVNIADATEVFYTYDVPAYSKVVAFKNNVLNRYFSFNSIDKITGEHIRIDVPKLALNPSDSINFMSPDAEGVTTITAKALVSKTYTDSFPYSIKRI